MLTMHVAAFAGHEVEQPEVFRLNICSDTAMHAGRATLQLQGMKRNKVSGSKNLLAKQVGAAGAGPDVGQAQVVQLNSLLTHCNITYRQCMLLQLQGVDLCFGSTGIQKLPTTQAVGCYCRA